MRLQRLKGEIYHDLQDDFKVPPRYALFFYRPRRDKVGNKNSTV